MLHDRLEFKGHSVVAINCAGSPCGDFGAFVFDGVDVFQNEVYQRGIRPENRGDMREIDLQICPEARGSERLTGLIPAYSR